ncbi:hypothetical protein NSA47_00165 [Irregularibacter muris]|uniref:Uncharacterized protein n=1 Tax=Irregularibacter muris TaxID=1796619 RepID=A0AAE3HC67_9FIRM|nr:hypothetical protein [Irregularibacter muris]MCR1897402.1 hypothetical protein [Irregularibacter muris]
MIARNIIVRGNIKRVCFSNTYYTFDGNGVFENSDEINKRSLLVYKKGSNLYDKALEYGITKNLIKYKDEVYYFIEKEKGKELYVLLIDIIHISGQSSIPTKINIPSDYIVDDYHLINTYEAFIEYNNLHGYPASLETNHSFFGDFLYSLFSVNFAEYSTSDFFDFFTLENKMHPHHYFYFLVFEGYLCLIDYKYSQLDFRDISPLADKWNELPFSL